MIDRYALWNMVRMNTAGEGDAGADTGAAEAGAEKDTASILYGDDDKPADEGQKDGEKPADQADAGKPASEWKEYENDPAKSEVENAAAKAEHDKTKPADDAGNKVPEDGKYDLKMPEGIELDTELSAALSPQFKDAGLTNAQAQKLVDAYTKVQMERAKASGEGWAKTVSDWVDTAKADKDIGGAKWDGTVTHAQRAVKSLGTPELREYLDQSGGGNHPELIRFMAKVGAMIGEDNPAAGNTAGKVTKDRSEILYPDDQPRGN